MRRIINVGYGLDRTVTKNEYLDLRAGQDPPLHYDCKLRKIHGKIPIFYRQKRQKTNLGIVQKVEVGFDGRKLQKKGFTKQFLGGII